MSNADEHTGLGAYFLVYALLMVGLLATVAVAFVPLGNWNLVVALTIAFTKAILVVLIFMHVLNSPRLTWIAVFAGLIWLAIMLSLMMADYVTRSWLPDFSRAPADMALPTYRELVPLSENAVRAHHGGETHGEGEHDAAHADEAHEETPADPANADEE
jgi:cytochrome c oxidase subunit IV